MYQKSVDVPHWKYATITIGIVTAMAPTYGMMTDIPHKKPNSRE